MAAKFINIEVGERFIKVCQTEKKQNRVSLKKAFIFPTPAGAVMDSLINDSGVLATAIKSKLRDNGMGDIKSVNFTVSTNKIATREVMLPPIKENRVKSIIDTNVEEYFPVDVSNYLISHGMFKTVNDGPEKGSHMLVMAAPMQLLDGYIKLADKMELDINAIDFGGNGQFQVIKSLNTNKVTMCITVDLYNTYITIVRDDRLLLQRSIPWGGGDLVEAYLESVSYGKPVSSDDDSEIDADEYFNTLEKCCVPIKSLVAGGVLSELDITSRLNRIMGGISRSMDFFNSSKWSSPIDDVVLAGTCSGIAGLQDAVSATLGNADIALFESFPFVSQLQGEPIQISRFMSVYGSGFAPIDLLPSQFKANRGKKKNTEKSIAGAVAILAACAIASGGLIVFSFINNSRLSNERDELIQAIEAAKPAEQVQKDSVQFSKADKDFKILDNLTDSNNRRLVFFFKEFEEKMPSGVLLQSAVCKNENVILGLRVSTLPEAAKAIMELGSFDKIGRVDNSAITEGIDELGLTYYSFTVTCTYENFIVQTTAVTTNAETEEELME